MGTRIDFDAKARTWDDDPAKVDRAVRTADAIRASIPVGPATRVFEFGCGTGLLGFALQPFVKELTLADASDGMLQVLRDKIAAAGARNMTPVKLDLVAEPGPQASFDLVCTLLTLHHVRDVEVVLRRFHGLLVPGGHLAVSDLDAEDGSFHGPGVEVHHGFDRAALGRQLDRAGFADVRFSTPFAITKGDPPRRYPAFLALARRPR